MDGEGEKSVDAVWWKMSNTEKWDLGLEGD